MIKIISLADRFTKDEWTLRDTQRYLYKRKNRYGSRPGGLYIPTVFGPWAIASDFQSLGIYFNSLDEYISVIDRMVRKYGPDAIKTRIVIQNPSLGKKRKEPIIRSEAMKYPSIVSILIPMPKPMVGTGIAARWITRR